MNVARLSGDETRAEYFLPPSPQPPRATINVTSGYVSRRPVKFLKPFWFTSIYKGSHAWFYNKHFFFFFKLLTYLFFFVYFGIENARGPRRVVHSDERVNDVSAIFDRYVVYGVLAYARPIYSPIAEIADDFRTIYCRHTAIDVMKKKKKKKLFYNDRQLQQICICITTEKY